MIQLLQKLFEKKYFPIFCALLGILVMFPSINVGLFLDDFIYKSFLTTSVSLTSLIHAIENLYAFIYPSLTASYIKQGLLPWWTMPSLTVAFFRPILTVTHWLDYQLWPNIPPLMHLQSILWYGAACGLIAVFYRKFIRLKWIAGLAALFFALDYNHLGITVWVANRDRLLLLFFGILALLMHDQWRRNKKSFAAFFSIIFFVSALLTAESGIGILGYFLAYTVFLETSPVKERIKSLTPYILVVFLWGLFYHTAGYGVSGGGVYINPLQNPIRFIPTVLERAPVLLAQQFGFPSILLPKLGVGVEPTTYNFFSPFGRRIFWVASSMYILILAFLFTPLIRKDKLARFWAMGICLTVVPACAMSILGGKLLGFVGIGTLGLIAQFLGTLFENAQGLFAKKSLFSLIFGLYFLVFYLLISPFFLVVFASQPVPVQTESQKLTNVNVKGSKSFSRVIIVNAPSPFYFVYLGSIRHFENQSVSGSIRILSPGYFPLTLTRLNSHDIFIRLNDKKIPLYDKKNLYHDLDQFFRSPEFPMKIGQRVDLENMIFEVVSVRPDGLPRETRVHFTGNIEDEPYTWLQWNWQTNSYEEFKVPKIGERVKL